MVVKPSGTLVRLVASSLGQKRRVEQQKQDIGDGTQWEVSTRLSSIGSEKKRKNVWEKSEESYPRERERQTRKRKMRRAEHEDVQKPRRREQKRDKTAPCDRSRDTRKERYQQQHLRYKNGNQRRARSVGQRREAEKTGQRGWPERALSSKSLSASRLPFPQIHLSVGHAHRTTYGSEQAQDAASLELRRRLRRHSTANKMASCCLSVLRHLGSQVGTTTQIAYQHNFFLISSSIRYCYCCFFFDGFFFGCPLPQPAFCMISPTSVICQQHVLETKAAVQRHGRGRKSRLSNQIILSRTR